MARRAGDREIDLRRAAVAPDTEVVELPLDAPARPAPLRLFAGLDEPPELPYAPAVEDGTGLAGLWRAFAGL